MPKIASPVERSQTISAPATATSGELKQLTTTTVTAPSSATVSKSFHSTASKAKAASAAGLDGFSVLPWHLFVAALSESALTLLTTAFAARNTQDEIQKGCSTYIDGGRMDQMSGLMTRLSVC